MVTELSPPSPRAVRTARAPLLHGFGTDVVLASADTDASDWKRWTKTAGDWVADTTAIAAPAEKGHLTRPR